MATASATTTSISSFTPKYNQIIVRSKDRLAETSNELYRISKPASGLHKGQTASENSVTAHERNITVAFINILLIFYLSTFIWFRII